MEKKKFVTVGRETVPFDVDGVEHVLHPATGAAARKYREASLTGAEMDYETGDDAAKRVTVRRLQAVSGIEAVLVAECCFCNGVKVPQATIEGWPGDIQKWAFGEIKRISPWLDESPETGLAALKQQRDRLNEKIAKLESADPKE